MRRPSYRELRDEELSSGRGPNFGNAVILMLVRAATSSAVSKYQCSGQDTVSHDIGDRVVHKVKFGVSS